jgi:hypothetical protein
MRRWELDLHLHARGHFWRPDSRHFMDCATVQSPSSSNRLHQHIQTPFNILHSYWIHTGYSFVCRL